MSTVTRHLSHLERSGHILLARVRPDMEYLFRHALMQDAAYDGLLPADRRRLHRVVGRAVEHLYPDRLDEYAATLARHFERADEIDLARTYLRRAADAALAAYANREAEAHYRRAIELKPPPDAGRHAHYLGGLGEALFRQARFEEARSSWKEGIRLYRRTGHLDAAAHLYTRSARALWHEGRHESAVEMCREGLDAVADAPESAEMAQLLHETGRAHYFQNQIEPAWGFCERALAMAERHGAVAVQADTLATMGLLPHVPGREPLDLLTRAADLAESAGALEPAIRAHNNMAGRLIELFADFEGAHRHRLRAADLARKRGAGYMELLVVADMLDVALMTGPGTRVHALVSRIESLSDAAQDPRALRLHAHYLSRQGEWNRALSIWRHTYDRAVASNAVAFVLLGARELSQAILEMDRYGELGDRNREAVLAEVEALLRKAIALDPGEGGGGTSNRCQLATVQAHRGEIAAARALLAAAPQFMDAEHEEWEMGIVYEAEGWAARYARDWKAAVDAFEKASTQSEQLGVPWDWAYRSLALADTLVARGEPADVERARALLRKVRDTFRDVGAPYYAALAEERLEDTRSRAGVHIAAFKRASHELAVAGRVQAGLLPGETPYYRGWQIAATLEPARETSGDFYDYIRLLDGKLALVVADVSDKGAGPALYMALTRTLLRTYTAAHPGLPAAVLDAANRRIVSETDTGMFVTLFYGVLDPAEGTLTYANAGHNPPFLIRAAPMSENRRSEQEHGGGEPAREEASARAVELLRPTGMALGVIAEAGWRDETVRLDCGDTLVIFTDGAVDAEAATRERFGVERLLASALDVAADGAREVQETMLARIHAFAGDAPRYDDVTLMVVRRA